jgi:ferrous iron transport protein B
VILASAILVWAITSLPARAVEEGGLARSAAGSIGKFIEPVFKPLGFDWKIAVATVTGFAAKEVVVSTLGVLYSVGTEETEDSEGLRDALRSDPTFNPLVAFVLMLFTLTIPPCFAALATIKSELGWRWLGFAFLFMLAVGWVLGFAVYQAGSLAGLGAAAAAGSA